MVRALSTTINAISEREISIFPRSSGLVIEVPVEEGDRVPKDSVLMRLDPRELQAVLDEATIARREAVDSKRALELAVKEAESLVERAQLTYEQSKKELERKEAAGIGIISQNDLENLRLTVRTNASDVSAQLVGKERADAALSSQSIAVDRANLQISTAELNLSFTEVKAPFDGVIASRTAQVGDLASGSTVAFTLTDPDNVRAVVSRPQREFAFFRAAEVRARPASDARMSDAASLDIEIEPEALPGEVYTGRILFVSPTIDAASGQFRVTLAVDQPQDEEKRPPVLPGMLLRVRIVTERHPNALAVPKRALLREGDSHFVFVADGDKARRVRVEEGFSTDDNVEVVPTEANTLSAGDAVIVVGNRDLEDGDSIEPSPWPARQAPVTAKDPEADAASEQDTDDA
ncbi:MAG: RND family efflux transporter MFP subunit [Planctomycetota bacterium]|jgi:membrane fusion protein (multidrug efflux system)